LTPIRFFERSRHSVFDGTHYLSEVITNHPQMTQITQMLRILSTLPGASQTCFCVICVICGLSSSFNVSPKLGPPQNHNLEVSHANGASLT